MLYRVSPLKRTPCWLLASIFLVFTQFLVFSQLGCVAGPPTVSPLYDRLSGRGPILLGDDNPHLAANAFYKEQVRGSPTLKDFVSHNGEPAAISLERRLYRATRLSFYYIDRQQVVTFKRWALDWEAEPASPISADDRQSLALQLSQTGGDAGLTKRARVSASTTTQQTSVASLGGGELRGRLRAPETAQEARFVRLPNGNYEHRVTFQGETFRVIAEWYTEDALNAGAIAAASGRKPSALLALGQVVTIPKNLMRNVQPLPEAAVP